MVKKRRGRPAKIAHAAPRTVRLPRTSWAELDEIAGQRPGLSTNDLIRALLAHVAGSELFARVALRTLAEEVSPASG